MGRGGGSGQVSSYCCGGSEGSPSESIVADDAELLSGFVDEFAEFLGAVDDGGLVGVLLVDDFPDGGVLPGRGDVEFASAFELLLGLDLGVVDPLALSEGDVGAEGAGALVEDFNFLGRELAVEDFEVLAGWAGEYLRECRLPWKRLLLSSRLLATYSLAPYLGWQVR